MSDGKSDAANPPAPPMTPAAPPASDVPMTVVGEVPASLRMPPAGAGPQTTPQTFAPQTASPATIVGTVPGSFPGTYPPSMPPASDAPPYAQAAPIPYHMPPAAPQPGYAPYPALGYGKQMGEGKWQTVIMFVRFHLSRAVARDLRAVDVSPNEEPILEAHGVRDHTIRQYLLWRRSWLYLLLPLALTASIIQLIGFFAEDIDVSTMSWFGIIVLGGTMLLHMIGYPIAAGIAVWKWDDLKLSRWALLAGWAAAYLLPFAVALIPFGNFIVINETDPEIIRGQKFGAGIAGAFVWLLWLLPATLAIMPGILRASVRIKSLLPESIVPGWIIVMTAPFFTLVLLLVFVVVNQIAGNLLLILGVLMIMASPVVFLTRTDLLIKPVTEFKERRWLESTQIVYVVVIGIGMALLMTYIYTLEVLGRPIVGNTADAAAPALMSVGRFSWEVISFFITYCAQSVFITAVAIDLFMLLNLSVWKNLKAFEGSPHAAEYDRIMGSFRNLAEGKDDPSRPFAAPATRAFEIAPPQNVDPGKRIL
jgi:hypothetical protein